MEGKAGQIVRRGERTWLVRIDLGRDESGKRRRVNRTVHGARRDAQRVLTQLLRERDLGGPVEPTRMSLDAYLDRWLETSAKPRLTSKTTPG